MSHEIGITGDAQLSDDFATIPDVPIQADANRVNPNQVASGVTRGAQKFVNLDGSYVVTGSIPDNSGDIGIAFFNSSNQLISKNLGKTQYIYNPTTGKIITQIGSQTNGDSALKFFDSNSIGLAQFGTFPSGGTALKVAKSGIEVSTATNDQLIFNSSQNVFKIVQSSTTSITPPTPWPPGGANKQRVTIAHNLGIKPAILVYVDNPVIAGVSDSGDGLALVPNPLFLTSSYNTVIQSAAHVDTVNLYIDLIFLNTAGTNLSGANAFIWNYRYYILQETAN